MSKEEENEPNDKLYKNWDKVFRTIPGFEGCTCLRRATTPRGKDPDFFLLDPGPEPKIGLVECEGYKGKNGKEKRIAPIGVQQLLTYLHGYANSIGDGNIILERVVKDAFLKEKPKGKRYQRGEDNRARWNGGLEVWMRQIGPSIRNEPDLADLLGRASRNLVPILLYYRVSKLEDDDERMLSLAFRRHRLYVGSVNWPKADVLIAGRYLSE